MTLVDQDQTWAAQGACAKTDPDALFVRGSAQRQVRQLCFDCPVRIECLADALNSNMLFGVWGGLTERERRAILRHCPDEQNWLHRITTSNDKLAVELRTGHIPRFANS
ncbi:WhiB family redox-sensing transcriptional regulator [Arcanobacterium pluranimalium]|uniref:WhiB family transcriptional regulator n=1 Tax=Arcanobacterium pluranimalium TaxID=108028 RepID=UPI00195AEBCB|nr:WhiB family transcriptional regulator [Arcanobacterium pluranimalium]MBM7824529.1 WhiB family redox-sensing transcriptional regulator [Arcanobacterium pluranimalium]